MTGTLIIPDIHDRIDQLKRIDRQFGHDLPRIYLGDWTDSFNQTPDNRDATLRYLAQELGTPNRTFLWGNHDWHYSPAREFVCSGYRNETFEAIQELLPVDWESYFTFHHEAAGWLLSHAGFNKPPSSFTTGEMAHQVGTSRGGDSKEGGPLWLDWNREFVGLNPGIPYHMNQIVGHTTQPGGPSFKNGSVCLDTGLQSVGLLLETGELQIHTIHPVTGKKKGRAK